MIRILESKDAGRLLPRKAARMAEAEAWCARFWKPCGSAATARCWNTRANSTGLRGRACGSRSRSCAQPRQLTPDFRGAVETAAANIRAYAERQMPREWTREVQPGVRLGQIVRPLDTVAAYIPAGRYPLPSTIMMTVVPAQVAGRAEHLRGLATGR